MPLKGEKPRVKGTTRVSFQDRELVRKLHSADKNSRQGKQQRTRELSRADKALLAEAPHQRAQKAFKEWLKKVRTNPQILDIREEKDEPLAVVALCDIEWDELTRRQERMQNLQSALEIASSRPDMTKEGTKLFKACIDNLEEQRAPERVPLLSGKRQMRTTSFRQRRSRRAALFACRPAVGSLSKVQTRNTNQSKSCVDSETEKAILCDPMPAADGDVDSYSIAYTCAACGEPVVANVAIVEKSGLNDAYFYHPNCFP